MLHANRITSIKRDLSIITWNANSLLPKLEELREFLARRKPDVLLLSETWLRANNNVRLPNYAFYRDDRPCLLYTSRCV